MKRSIYTMAEFLVFSWETSWSLLQMTRLGALKSLELRHFLADGVVN